MILKQILTALIRVVERTQELLIILLLTLLLALVILLLLDIIKKFREVRK